MKIDLEEVIAHIEGMTKEDVCQSLIKAKNDTSDEAEEIEK